MEPVFPGNKYVIFSLKTGPWAGMFSGSMFAVFGLGVQDFRRVAKRRQLCVLQGEHARNVQRSRNHKSKNDKCYAFYKEHKPATVRCRGITSPKTTTVLHFATTKNKKSQANQIEKSQANPGRSHKRTLYRSCMSHHVTAHLIEHTTLEKCGKL